MLYLSLDCGQALQFGIGFSFFLCNIFCSKIIIRKADDVLPDLFSTALPVPTYGWWIPGQTEGRALSGDDGASEYIVA